jgi:AraC-like DNA-binding protein
MIFKEILPSKALQYLVKSYLLVHWDVGKSPQFTLVKPYPTCLEQSLVFFVHGYIHSEDLTTNITQKINTNAIFGQQVARLNFHCTTCPDFLMFKVDFQPSGLYRLGLPAHELTHCFVDSESVFNSEVRQINERLANASSYTEMIEIVENYLLCKIKKVKTEPHHLDKVANLLYANPSRFSLDYLADQSCLSPRQFERKFTERMGVNPKLYSRISRFYQAFSFKEANPATDWLTIALNFGYHDYQHLSKDFKQFGNVTPNILIDEYALRVEKLLGLV